MPHVDEGTLHALLDGALRAESPDEADRAEAHLRACEDCRARYERAAELRDAATGVLATMDVDARPDFDEVLRRAGGAGAPGAEGLARQARWTRGLAWAATIVIALGTGYLVGERFGGLEGLARSDVESTGDAADPADLETVEAGMPEDARIETEDRSRPTTGAGSPAAERGAGGGAVRETPPRPRPQPVQPVVPDAESDAAGAARKLAPPEPEPEPAPPAVADAGEVADTGKVGILEEQELAGEGRAEPAGSIPTLALRARTERVRAQEFVADSAAVGDPEDEIRLTPAAAAERAAPTTAEAGEPAPVGDARTDTTWRPVDLDTARRAVGDSLYVLPKAEPVAFFVRPDSGGAVMTVQRLGSGVRVRVVQVRRVIPVLSADTARDADAFAVDLAGEAAAPADADSALPAEAAAQPDTAGAAAAGEEAAPETSAARAVVGGFTIQVSGPLPTELLQILAAAATPMSR